MLKLARNALANLREIEYNLTTIKWDYIVKLHELQNNLTFKLKNKLNSQCILCTQNKMKVKYAANTLSASVANAIDFLRNQGIDKFKGSAMVVQSCNGHNNNPTALQFRNTIRKLLFRNSIKSSNNIVRFCC